VKLLREPLVYFLFIGAVIYLSYAAFAEPLLKDDDKTIVVTAGEPVTQDWSRDRVKELNGQFCANLRDQFTVVIEEPALGNKVVEVLESAR